MSRVFESNLILILIRQGHLFEDEKIEIICRKKHFPSLPYLFFFFAKVKLCLLTFFPRKPGNNDINVFVGLDFLLIACYTRIFMFYDKVIRVAG